MTTRTMSIDEDELAVLMNEWQTRVLADPNDFSPWEDEIDGKDSARFLIDLYEETK